MLQCCNANQVVISSKGGRNPALSTPVRPSPIHNPSLLKRAGVGKEAFVQLGHGLLHIGKLLGIIGGHVVVQAQLARQFLFGSNIAIDQRAVDLLGVGHHDKQRVRVDDGVAIPHDGLDDQIALLGLRPSPWEQRPQTLGCFVQDQLQQTIATPWLLPRQPIENVGRGEDRVLGAAICRRDRKSGSQTLVDVELDTVGVLNGRWSVQRSPEDVGVDLGCLKASLLQQLRDVVVVSFPERISALIFHSSLQILNDDLPLFPRQMPIVVDIAAKHDITPQQGFAMPLDEVMKRRIPRVELEARFATESLASALQLWPWEGRDGFPHNAARQGMTEVTLTLPLTDAESSIEEPGRVDQIGFLPKSVRVHFGRRRRRTVRIGLETHNWPEQWRINIGRRVFFAEEHVV